MPWAAAAAVVGAGITANASGKAAKKQQEGTDKANALSGQQAYQVRQDLTPYRDLGAGASNKLAYMLGVDQPATASKIQSAGGADEITQAYRDLLGRNPDQGGY